MQAGGARRHEGGTEGVEDARTTLLAIEVVRADVGELVVGEGDV